MYMKHDNKLWGFEGVEADNLVNCYMSWTQEKSDLLAKHNQKLLFDDHLADMWHWRQRKCDAMLKQIDKMIYAELGRRIKSDV